MTNSADHFPRPTRIDLATSETEGGDFLSWADPEQVIACVGSARPAGTFARSIEPMLADLDRVADTAPAGAQGRLPGRVRILLERLRQIHVDLYRANRSGETGGGWAKLSFVLVEENRVFFVKGTPCWIYRIREGTTNLECIGEGNRSGLPDAGGLGRSQRLPLEVTSLDVRPHDLVVLLAADSGESPDRRAVGQVFAQTHDLKRACDGLVNLLALQASGAGALAVRFVPVGGTAGIDPAGDGVIEDLERELVDRLRPGLEGGTMPSSEGGCRFGAVDREEIPLPLFLEGIATGPAADRAAAATPATGGEEAIERPDGEIEFAFPWESRPEDRSTPAPEFFLEEEADLRLRSIRAPEAGSVPVSQPGPAPVESRRGPADRSAGRVEGMPPASSGRDLQGTGTPARPVREKSTGIWAVSFAIVIALLVAVIGIPRGVKIWKAAGGEGPGGVLRVESTPPARAIFIDGVDMRTGSPTILEGVEPGLRRIRLDLGMFGVIERQVRIRDGETIDLLPRATGSLEIDVSIGREGAVAWVEGRAPRSVPCRWDSLPVGWLNLFYEDPQIPLWHREVMIRAGESQQIRINNAVASHHSLLRIESWLYREGAGLLPVAGDSLLLDGLFVGSTPWEGEVEPGLHGVQVRSANGQVWTEVVDLAAGSSRTVLPRFGMEPWPRIAHTEPGRVLLRGPLLLSMTVTTPDGSAPRNPRLHFPRLESLPHDFPLSPVDPAEGTYVAIIDPERIPRARIVEYYFTIETDGGRTVSSDLYRLSATSEMSQSLSR